MNRNKMKCCVVFVALCGAASTQANLFVSDSFEVGAGAYSAAELVGQDVTVTGMNGAWLNNTGHAVSATGLSYTDINYQNGTGGSVIANNNGVRAGRLLDTAYNSASVGSVYLSFLMQTLSNNNTTQYKAFELHDGGFNDAANRKFQLGVQGNNFGSTTEFGFRLVNNNTYQNQLGTLNTDVNLFVVKFDFSATAASDSVTVWQNPDLTGSGDPTGGVTVGGVDMAFDRISFARFNSSDAIAWDEIRMGDSFAQVIPEPATLGLIAAFGGSLLFLRRFMAI